MHFAEKLSALTSAEMRETHFAPDRMERMSEIIERLLFSAAFTIALAAKGDRSAMEKLLTGAESYLYESAAKLAPAGEILSREPHP